MPGAFSLACQPLSPYKASMCHSPNRLQADRQGGGHTNMPGANNQRRASNSLAGSNGSTARTTKPQPNPKTDRDTARVNSLHAPARANKNDPFKACLTTHLRAAERSVLLVLVRTGTTYDSP